MQFKVGTYDVEVKASVTKSDREVVNRWPSVQQWTFWKAFALLEAFLFVLCWMTLIASWRRGEPLWIYALMSLQAGFIFPAIYQHKYIIYERNQYHGEINGSF